MMGYIVLSVLNFVAIVAAWWLSLVAGMFLQRGGFQGGVGKNPGKAVFVAALVAGVLVVITNPSVYFGFGNAAAAIFGGLLGLVFVVPALTGAGYLLSEKRLSAWQFRTQRWLDSRAASGPGERRQPPPAGRV